MSFKRLPIILLVTVAAGCTTIGVMSDLSTVSSSVQPCYAALRNDPKYAHLHQHLEVDTGTMPSDEKLADPERPSPELIQKGMEWFERNQKCNTASLEAFSNFDPVLGARMAAWQGEMLDILDYAVSENPTYGQINLRIKHFVERKNADVKQYVAAETNRRKSVAQQQSVDVLSTVLDVAILALEARQMKFAKTQRVYFARVPTYRPVQIMKTVCHRKERRVFCLQLAIGLDDSQGPQSFDSPAPVTSAFTPVPAPTPAPYVAGQQPVVRGSQAQYDSIFDIR